VPVDEAVEPALGAATAVRTGWVTEVRVVPTVGLSVPTVERTGVVAVLTVSTVWAAV
jgi:hypothetical protein